MEALNRKAILAVLIILGINLLVRGFAFIDRDESSPIEHLTMDPAQVVQMEISEGGSKLLLSRTSIGWRNKLAGKDLPETQSREVERYLQRICTLVREPIFSPTQLNDASYGLDGRQALKIQLTFSDPSMLTFTARLGKRIPLNEMYVYGSFDQVEGIYRVLRTYRDSAAALLSELSQKRN